MKLCLKCQTIKSLSEFNKNSSRPDGLQGYCRQCFVKIKSINYKENKETLLSRGADYYKQNAKKCNESSASYYINNKTRVKSTQVKWREKNKLSLKVYRSNRRARIKNSVGTHTHDEIIKLFAFQKGKCACCNIDIKNEYHCDHIKPLFLGGRNDILNIQLLCATCNLSKGAKDPIIFMQSKGFLI